MKDSYKDPDIIATILCKSLGRLGHALKEGKTTEMDKQVFNGKPNSRRHLSRLRLWWEDQVGRPGGIE